jgi:hypothetical protein
VQQSRSAIRRARADSPESDKFEPASSHRKASLPQAIAPCQTENRTGIGPHLRPGKPTLISGPEIGYLEKPDRYWSAPKAAKSPVISVLEIGHLEKTEQVLVRNSGRGKPGDFSPENRVCQEV